MENISKNYHFIDSFIFSFVEPPRVATAVGPRGKRVQTPQPPPVRTPSVPLPAPAIQPAPSREQAAALAHAAKGVEALGVLVQYLVFHVSIYIY